ncbi:LTA synthase family protein [Motiliproteus sp. SC1-56]|uniref:LTA synthase family protein n=1 Tax=Motiliproteus sp. SC1-56 TaxID=2799565 RepID=UPI001A8C4A47|nr:LTA synthase family protein [Motiliproteus sp. SC1-56]
MLSSLLSSVARWLRPLWFFVITGLLITTLSRIGLLIWQSDRLVSQQDAWTVLGFGLRVDLSILCYWLLPALLAMLFFPLRWASWPVRIWLVAGLTLIAFMEVATPGFVAQYDLRPNRLFVEYLEYPQEVFGMLLGGFLPELVFGVVVLVAVPWACWRAVRRWCSPEDAWLPWWQRGLVLVPVLLLCVLGARGTLQHRPMNPSYTAFSTDSLVNALTLNSFYSVAFAVKAMRNEIDASELYPRMAEQEVFSTLRQAMMIPRGLFSSPVYPTWHEQRPSTSTALPRYKNLVIILEESLGAQYVGSLGGDDLTPELDALAKEGWLLDQLFATGTRSVRGIEAVITGFVPTPARSVVKLPRSQRNFFTLASLLKQQGYDTSFIYGGEGHFDNMGSFFLGNGFDRVVDQRHYKNPKFMGSWGVSDGDLLRKAHGEFSRLKQAGQPFFSLVFSSSNHTPYDYPEDEITPVEMPARSKRNAIRYADHALGEFFRDARASNYWEDTLFLVVADHDDRVYGRQLVPVEHFRIPGLLLGEGLPVKRDPRVFSQIDLPPTLLSLLGVEAAHPMVGHDITRLPETYPGRAIMQYDQSQAYWRGDEVVVLQPAKQPRTFKLDRTTYELVPTEDNPDLVKEALAHALWGSLAYKRGLYPASAGVEG